MKIKVGDIITLKQQATSDADRSRKVLAVFEDGMLVAYYPKSAFSHSFSMFVTTAYVPFTSIEEPPAPKALPGVTYRNKTVLPRYSIGLTNGKLGWVIGGVLREIDLTDQWEPVK